ncbi:MAG TPA: FixH family protein [Ktedonobacteraceae bacterium]|nr:FixH family protein [Ktedonobacteraceae bacterium]
MRVRPFFWLLLAASCVGVLIFAAMYQTHAPAIMHVHLSQQSPRAIDLTTLELHLNDPEGVPIEDAQISSLAWMTNMQMQTPPSIISAPGQGNYLVQLHLSMAGPWAISVTARANGFTPLKQTVYVLVT